MSVMACDRQNCENIMCDKCILKSTAYICNSCWSELLEFKETWPTEMTALDVEDKIREFMSTRPGAYKVLENVDIDAEFRRLTGEY